MNVDDLYENFLRQKVNVMDAIKKSNRVLFVDTDSITTLFYANFLLSSKKELSRCKKLAESINDITDWDLVIFLEPTVDFVQDGTRSEKIASDREKYSNQIKKLLVENNIRFSCVLGDYYERFVQAKRLLEKIGLTTIW